MNESANRLPPSPHWSRTLLLGALLLALVVALAYLGFRRGRARRNEVNPTPPVSKGQAAPPAVPAPAPPVQKTTLTVAPGSSIGKLLASAGVAPATAAQLLRASHGVYDLSRIQAGHELVLTKAAAGGLIGLTYEIAADRRLSVNRAGADAADWNAELITIPTEIRVAAVAGVVSDSLIGAVEAAGEQDQLGLSLANIFGWQLDFYTDPRPGDTFRVLVEKRYLEGHFSGYGKVLAAEYVNHGHAYEAIAFKDDAGAPAYYQPDGKPLKRMFLSSPLKFDARITSGFSLRRYHPILKVYRAHLGIDFAAPMRAPVQTIGSGVVTRAGRFGEDGNMVQIRHSGGYQTLYLHLSRILVKVGQHVSQGQQIGAVGMTGLATGPHLDFRIEQGGKFEDFEALRRKLPPDAPVAKAEWTAFEAQRDRVMQQLAQAHPADPH